MRKSKKRKRIEKAIIVFIAEWIIILVSGIAGLGFKVYSGFELLGYIFSAAIAYLGALVVFFIFFLIYQNQQKKEGGRK